MSHPEGTYLGSIRNLATLKGRCVVDAGDDGCWHLRSAQGRRNSGKRQTLTVWVNGRGAVSAAKFAVECYTGEAVPAGKRVTRICNSDDCVRPKHNRPMTPTEQMAHWAERGLLDTPARLANARKAGMRNAKLTPELRVWLIESPQDSPTVAHGLGIGYSRVYTLRKQAQQRASVAPSSVFSFAGGSVERIQPGA